MTEVAQALYTFYSGFDIPAYTENNVPEDAGNRYITYSLVQPDWRENAIHYARVWDYNTSSAWCLSKADEILAAIGEGISIQTDHGCVVLRPGTPLVQEMIGEQKTDRSAFINLQINAFQTKGA